MQVDQALDRIAEIHGHLTRAEVYRGYRPVPVALSGLLALAGSLAAPYLVEPGPNRLFVLYWTGIAGLSALACGGEILFAYARRESELERRKTRRVLAQFGPCVAAGAVTTYLVAGRMPELIWLLPGLWALLFGLGILASRPYLPHAIGWVGLYYLVLGLGSLAAGAPGFSGWTMGAGFGIGQIASALVLERDVRRGE